MVLGSCYIFFFQTYFRSVKFKVLPARHDASNSDRTSYHDFEKKLLNIFREFYQRNVRLSFLDWEPKCGDNIHHTVLSIFEVDQKRMNMGVARIFQRGGHTDSYIGYSPNCHLNIVGCLLTKRLTKGGSWAPQDPPPPATPLMKCV